MDGQLVKFEYLPSQGKQYPEEMEIYIKPISLREQIDMDRYGISQAEYYQQALDGITIKGDFDKTNLLFYDVQFMDLIRRLYTFDTEDEIVIKDYVCPSCDGTVDYSFMLDQVKFTDYKEDIFNKVFTFSDGLEIVIYPLTVLEFIRMAKKYFSNGSNKSEADAILGYYNYCIKEVKNKEFKNNEERNKFLTNYLGNINKYKDIKILKQIEEDTTCQIVPFETTCPKCGGKVEVRLFPSAQFQQ